jgi:methylenetetrahydrofolate dehydrogenase (NADP+)/methenyltetrahydrofolate cyclohydrolase
MAIIFDGKKLAAEKEKILAKKVAEFKKATGIRPKLVAVMVGEDEASKIYLRKKSEAAKRVGMEMEIFKLNEPEELIKLIREKNKDKKTHGVMIQMPIEIQNLPPSGGTPPKAVAKSLPCRQAGKIQNKFKIQNPKFKILGAIEPRKDVDCLTPENFGLLAMGKPRFLPATVKAIMEIINVSGFRLQASSVVIVGASNIVGKPLALHLSNLGATVTICRSKTKNLEKYTRQADLLVSATGVPKLIRKDMVKKNAVVIDVGSPVGDVDFENVSKIASFITPVPGGVGPMTVVCLLENVLQAAKLKKF